MKTIFKPIKNGSTKLNQVLGFQVITPPIDQAKCGVIGGQNQQKLSDKGFYGKGVPLKE